MSDQNNPFARWSRRKRAAATANKQAAASPKAAESPRKVEDHAPSEGMPQTEPIKPPLDVDSLPPIDSITAETDIRAFLAAGVPPELTRAALRRLWSTDPKIRNFVGPADYDWDFNAPGAMAGFGPLNPTNELRKQIMQAIQGSAPGAGSSPQQPEDILASGEDKSAPALCAARADNQDQSPSAPSQVHSEDTALQQQSEKAQSWPPSKSRKQGGALPK